MAILFAALLTFSMAASMALLPSANAHSPAWQIPTESYINVGPNPAGVGQTVTVDFWLMEPPPTAEVSYGDRWAGLTVLVTLPDGTTAKLGPFTTDATGGTTALYTPSELGNYTFVMSFPGQTLSGTSPGHILPPQGYSAAIQAMIGDYFEPSTSATVSLTVQQQSATTIPNNPLPTNYWTRPINAENNNWYSIAGNWLGTAGYYNVSGNYNPYSLAPTTAHILWTEPEAFGGTVGGEAGGSETSNYYTNRQYEIMFKPIIMQGILYYTQYPGSNSYPAGWVAVNLQTGQTLWTKSTTDVLYTGQLFNYVSPNQYGYFAYLWSNSLQSTTATGGTGPAVNGTVWQMWDAMTGDYILSVIGGSTMTITNDQSGSLIGYFVNTTAGTQIIQGVPVTTPQGGSLLECWNSTADILMNQPPEYYGPTSADAWLWRPPTGAQIPFSSGVEWAVPLPTTINGNPMPGALSVSAANSGVLIMSASSTLIAGTYQFGWQIEAGYNANTGAQLWITNRTETPFTRLTGPTSFEDGYGVYAETNLDTFVVNGYSINTGTQLWTITLPNANSYDTYLTNGMVANGTLYEYGMGGDVYAINILTGALLWHYTTGSAGANTPYGIWPVYSQSQSEAIADGMLFFAEGHEYSPPLFRGAQEVALNLTDGQPVWSLLAFNANSPPAISDGVLTFLNDYDNQIYALGMGPSATTVTAPDIGVTTATPVTITGTVTDISAGSQQNAVAANFPHGLPCVSDASQSAWMEYVYEQQPMPTNATGVQVTLTAIDPNHNLINIGTATTDTSGNYGFIWTPPQIPGPYQITATFSGTNSYYSSSDTTYMNLQASATPAPTAAPVTGLATMSGLTYGIVAVIIVMIIAIAIVGLLIIRKKP
jgi:outer membrane protein assembly factor BamB